MGETYALVLAVVLDPEETNDVPVWRDDVVPLDEVVLLREELHEVADIGGLICLRVGVDLPESGLNLKDLLHLRLLVDASSTFLQTHAVGYCEEGSSLLLNRIFARIEYVIKTNLARNVLIYKRTNK